MAFTVPTFNLQCNVYTGPWVGKVFRDELDCNLAVGRRVQQFQVDGAPPPLERLVTQQLLLLPALSDIRNEMLTGVYDVVEVPKGSGRWYAVGAVDDIGKGFDNEHRVAWLTQISQHVSAVEFAGCFWPVPMP